MDLAIKFGCKTAKDFADFLKKYGEKIELTGTGKEIIQLSLFR